MDTTYPKWSKTSVASESRCSHLNNDASGEIAIIGIGNPLRNIDRLGPYVVTLAMQRTGDGVCCINLESHCNYLVPILNEHKTAIIVDSVKNLGEKESLLIEIDEQIKAKSQDIVENSHGISWMDELRLFDTKAKKVYLFGVSSKLAEGMDSNNKEKVANIEDQINRLLGFICLLNDEETTKKCLESKLGFQYTDQNQTSS